MRINFAIKGGLVKARLSDALDITTAQQARDNLLQLLHGGDACELNLGGITDFDTAGLQLLLAFQRDAARLEKPCVFTNPSPTIQEVATLLGMSDRFQPTVTVS